MLDKASHQHQHRPLPEVSLNMCTPHSLCLISLLEWLTELRETFYWLDYLFIIKRYNLGTAGWERCIGKLKELPHSPSTPMGSPTGSSQSPVLSGVCGRFTASSRLVKSLAICDWVHSPAPLPSWRVGLKVPIFQLQRSFPWQPAPILRWPRGFPKVTSLT